MAMDILIKSLQLCLKNNESFFDGGSIPNDDDRTLREEMMFDYIRNIVQYHFSLSYRPAVVMSGDEAEVDKSQIYITCVTFTDKIEGVTNYSFRIMYPEVKEIKGVKKQ